MSITERRRAARSARRIRLRLRAASGLGPFAPVSSPRAARPFPGRAIDTPGLTP
ncbi:hypothetical protein ACIREE_28605 [Streptomyces sp. NPDC102467]|uniref:hypothetical protein n=1 Tax=Streptomyces sp. NPDC102467 TaxID=3366179 RepID=UPI003819779A